MTSLPAVRLATRNGSSVSSSLTSSGIKRPPAPEQALRPPRLPKAGSGTQKARSLISPGDEALALLDSTDDLGSLEFTEQFEDPDISPPTHGAGRVGHLIVEAKSSRLRIHRINGQPVLTSDPGYPMNCVLWLPRAYSHVVLKVSATRTTAPAHIDFISCRPYRKLKSFSFEGKAEFDSGSDLTLCVHIAFDAPALQEVLGIRIVGGAVLIHSVSVRR